MLYSVNVLKPISINFYLICNCWLGNHLQLRKFRENHNGWKNLFRCFHKGMLKLLNFYSIPYVIISFSCFSIRIIFFISFEKMLYNNNYNIDKNPTL